MQLESFVPRCLDSLMLVEVVLIVVMVEVVVLRLCQIPGPQEARWVQCAVLILSRAFHCV